MLDKKNKTQVQCYSLYLILQQINLPLLRHLLYIPVYYLIFFIPLLLKAPFVLSSLQRCFRLPPLPPHNHPLPVFLSQPQDHLLSLFYHLYPLRLPIIFLITNSSSSNHLPCLVRPPATSSSSCVFLLPLSFSSSHYFPYLWHHHNGPLTISS